MNCVRLERNTESAHHGRGRPIFLVQASRRISAKLTWEQAHSNPRFTYPHAVSQWNWSLPSLDASRLLRPCSWMLRKWNRFFSIGQMRDTFASTLVLARYYRVHCTSRCGAVGRRFAVQLIDVRRRHLEKKRPLRTVYVRCYGTTYYYRLV